MESQEPVRGPLQEKEIGAWRRLGRFLLGKGPVYEHMDLSGLNDENDPPGLAMSVGGPTTRRELYSLIKERQDRGEWGPLRIDRGFGLRGDRSTSMYTGGNSQGAPIVDDARALRARKEGRVPLSSGVSHPEAKRLLEQIYDQRPQPESTD